MNIYMNMCPNSKARIWHDLATDLLFWILGGNHFIGSQIIPYCCLMNWLVRYPDPFWKRF